MNYIEQYLEEIRTGKRIVSRRVRAVYERLVDDIKNPKNGFIFDEKKAQRPIDFMQRFCRHSKGEWAGQPVSLELFQLAFISALFGFVDQTTGARKYREAFLFMARKNGKTTLAAGIALYMLIADGESGSEVYSAATKRDQAKLLFDEAINMVRQSKELSEICTKRRSDLYFPLTFSKMQPLSKAANSLDGLNAHCVVLDEAHALTNRETYEVLKQSQSARRQPLFITITTAGTVRESIFDDLYKYATGIADGVIEDNTFLPVLYELDAKDEFSDPLKWEKANPALGSIKKISDLVTKVERAKNSPADLAGVLCKDFNIRSTASAAWLTWEAIENKKTFDIADFRGAYFVGGVDLSITVDLTSAAAILMDKAENKYIITMSWLPEENFYKRCEEDKLPWAAWKERGLLRLCAGNTINPADVTAWFRELVEVHGLNPAYIGYDSYSSRYFVDEMEQSGFRMERVIQGSKTLSAPLYSLGAEFEGKRIIYNDNPLFAWACGNVGVTRDRNNNIVPVKATGSKYKIDPFAAALDAYVMLQEHYTELKNLI